MARKSAPDPVSGPIEVTIPERDDFQPIEVDVAARLNPTPAPEPINAPAAGEKE